MPLEKRKKGKAQGWNAENTYNKRKIRRKKAREKKGQEGKKQDHEMSWKTRHGEI